MNRTLRQQRYEELKRSGRGWVRRYVEKMTGLSRAQTTRLITMYLRGEEVKPQAYRRRRFARRYTGEDIALLAEHFVQPISSELGKDVTGISFQQALSNLSEQAGPNRSGIREILASGKPLAGMRFEATGEVN